MGYCSFLKSAMGRVNMSKIRHTRLSKVYSSMILVSVCVWYKSAISCWERTRWRVSLREGHFQGSISKNECHLQWNDFQHPQWITPDTASCILSEELESCDEVLCCPRSSSLGELFEIFSNVSCKAKLALDAARNTWHLLRILEAHAWEHLMDARP